MTKISKEFKEVETAWYKKLKEAGFDDIENQETHDLKKYSNNLFFKHSSRDVGVVHKFVYVRRYFELAAQFVGSPEYLACISKNPKYARVWEMHADGRTYREIAKETGMHKMTALDVVKRLSKVMLESNNN